jgi:hypothetical protein
MSRLTQSATYQSELSKNIIRVGVSVGIVLKSTAARGSRRASHFFLKDSNECKLKSVSYQGS